MAEPVAMTLESARRTGHVPASALRMVVGPFELGDNGENAKSAPIRMKARTAQPIQHWFWGKVVHDMAGMRLHKERLPIDYVHDPAEVIGYLNHFHAGADGLEVSGALVPFKESDRATEIIHKARAGVPYEASIYFGGDGIKVEEVAQGQVAQVNGSQFDGPGIVIREWPLRGVAVCPYPGVIVQLGAGGAGAAAATFTARLPVDVKRYVRVKAVGSVAGDASAASLTFEVLF